MLLPSTDKGRIVYIKASLNDVLVLSFIGYAEQEISVNTQTSISVKLVSSITDLGQGLCLLARRAWTNA